jgi:hypothetical protein
MVKIVGNCDLDTASKFYRKYSHMSYWQRIAISRDVRKQHHEIVYGDHKGSFYKGINKTSPYPNFPVTKFIKDKMPYLNVYLPDLIAQIENEKDDNINDADKEYIENIEDYNRLFED